MADPREFWNHRYAQPGWAYGTEPNDLRTDFAGLTLERLTERERDVNEGDWHRGRSAVVQLIARRD